MNITMKATISYLSPRFKFVPKGVPKRVPKKICPGIFAPALV